MNSNILQVIVLVSLFVSCSNATQTNSKEKGSVEFKNKGHELVYNMVQTVGDYNTLSQMKDVVYTYTYQTPDGKVDISTEKYMFDGELSYGAYQQHERTFPELEGRIEQGYDGNEYWL